MCYRYFLSNSFITFVVMHILMIQGASTSSGRGKGSCPKCRAPYVNRYKPKVCSKCDFEIGGSYVPKLKGVSVSSAPASTIVAENESTKIYSVQTTTRNNRCFVTVENNMVMCHNGTCKETRSLYVHSGKQHDFKCKHSEKVTSSSQPLQTWNCTSSDVESYVTDASVKSELCGIVSDNPSLPHVVQVSEKVFAVFCQPTASNPMGYVHINKEGKFYSCSSKDCRAVKVKTKQLKCKNICIHIHMLLCCLNNEDGISSKDVLPDPDEIEIANLDSVSRQNTRRLYEGFTLPYVIDQATLARNKQLDCKTLQGEVGWPVVFEPTQETCDLCHSELGRSRCHPGANGNGILITCINPFRKIKILVKMCQEKSCQAMHRVMPTESGMYIRRAT